MGCRAPEGNQRVIVYGRDGRHAGAFVVHNTFPSRVDYAITERGRSLEKVINELRDWGKDHAKKIFGKKIEPNLLIAATS